MVPDVGTLFAFALNPFLRSILVGPLVDLIWLEAYADDLALSLATLWAEIGCMRTGSTAGWRRPASGLARGSAPSCPSGPTTRTTSPRVSSRSAHSSRGVRCRAVLDISGWRWSRRPMSHSGLSSASRLLRASDGRRCERGGFLRSVAAPLRDLRRAAPEIPGAVRRRRRVGASASSA